jgi:predicted ferric reductase
MYKKLWFRLVCSIHSVIILYFWWAGNGSLFSQDSSSVILALGRLAGLILVGLVLLQVLIMSRAPWMEQAFGLDALARVHHKVGRYFIIFLVAHPVLIIWSYSKFADLGFVAQYLSLLKSDEVIQSSIAFLLFLGIIIYSLLRIWKNWNFERWYYVHLAMYAAIVLAFLHQIELGGDIVANNYFRYYWYFAYAFVLIHLLWFRFTVPVLLYRKHKFTVSEVKSETHDVTSIYIAGQKMDEYPIRGGQFLIVRFLAKGFWWQAHPFTMSQHPNGTSLRLSIKASGDFSTAVSQLRPGIKAMIEGPYGIFTAEHSKTNKVLLIAGGIGITPYRSILEDLGKAGKDIVLIYANKTEADIALRSEMEELSNKYNIKIHHVLSASSVGASFSRPNTEAGGQGQPLHTNAIFHQGFVNNDLIKQLVPDVASREIFLCGPPPMLNALIKSLPSLRIPKNKIYFEKFSL